MRTELRAKVRISCKRGTWRRLQDHIARRRKRSDFLHHRHAHIALLKRAGIVESVAHHHHRVAGGLDVLDEIQFIERAFG